MKNNPGIFVISLDFELFWGVSDGDIDQYIDNLYGVPIAVKHILNAFDKYKIHATWATVGFLFFESKKELVKFMPSKLPEYIDKSLDPYNFIKLNLYEFVA